MKVLIACEFSGIVRNAFRHYGHAAYSCDLLPSEDYSKYHIQWNVLDVLDDGWDLMIAHPPCTFLCRSGERWMKDTIRYPNRKYDRWKAFEFFRKFLYSTIDKICIENPLGAISSKHKHDQIIHPWQFGHGECKSTCLWLKNLPLLKPTNIVLGREQRIHNMWNKKNKIRWKERSRTYTGIAEAMAKQWGNL